MSSSSDGGETVRTPTRFGPYAVISHLGAGGMGDVYRAHDKRLDRDVALKVIRGGHGDEAARRRFELEARAVARLSHPNIVSIYDVGEEGGNPYIVQELVAGGTLTQWLAARHGGFAEKLRVAVAIAEGLAEAHRNGIVHRDLKPDNVLLTTDGRPKISDFGLAKSFRELTNDDSGAVTAVASATREGAIVGTPAYMSPEQAAGVALDARSDQFSFASMLVEMFTGQRPFQRTTAVQTLSAVLDEEPVYAHLERSIPADVLAIIRRCLSKEPSGRYGSTDDLLHDLRATIPGVGARPRASWRGVLITLLAITLLALGLWLTAPAWRGHAAVVGGGPSTPIHSLAVLPLSNFSGDPSQQYFADGMTEELTSQLASLPSLRVVSRTSAGAYRGSTKPLSEVARELGVDGLIEGSVVRAGGNTRVTIQMIDGRTDRHLWAQTFDRRGDDILSLQRDVAARIVERMRAVVTPADRARLARLPTENVAAYDAYLHSVYKHQSPVASHENADEAVRYAEQAIAADPNFAEAYVLLAEACQAEIFFWNGGKEYDEKGFIAVEKALSLNPALPDAYVARGGLYYNGWRDFDLAASIADFRKAISLNPNLASAHHALGADLTHLGLHDEAVREFQTAIRLDPRMSGPKFRLGRPLWQSGRFAEALAAYDRYGFSQFEKAVVLGYLGKRDEAWRTLAAASAHPESPNPGSQRDGPSDLASARALLFAFEHDREKAHLEIRKSSELGASNPHFHHAAFFLAAACAELSQPGDAVHWLEIAARTGMPNLPLFRDNRSMRRLRGDPRYDRFLADLAKRWDLLAGRESQ